MRGVHEINDKEETGRIARNKKEKDWNRQYWGPVYHHNESKKLMWVVIFFLGGKDKKKKERWINEEKERKEESKKKRGDRIIGLLPKWSIRRK